MSVYGTLLHLYPSSFRKEYGDEMRALFVALGATRLPAHDVHGRSTIVQLSWPELERRFGRQ